MVGGGEKKSEWWKWKWHLEWKHLIIQVFQDISNAEK